MTAREAIPWTETIPDATVAHLRAPPHSVEAEQSVLGCLLLDNGAFDRVADLLTEGDFYRHEHRLVFGAIAALVMANKPADVITVFERLQAAGRVDDAGGLPHINALAGGVSSAANARRYAEIVRERSVLRQCITAADEVAAKAFRNEPARDVLELASASFGKMERQGQRSAPVTIGGLMLGALDRYQALSDGSRQAGIATGFRQLDKLLAPGLKPGKVYGVAARPSVGKSSSARSIGINVAREGRTVLILSQEMPQEEQADCVVAELGRVNGSRLQSGEFAGDDWTRICEAVEQARDLPLLFDEQGSLSIGDIRAKARAVKGLGLLIVDYLQLCSSTLKGKSTNDEIAEISKGLKALALELRIPVIVLSQLNRDVEKRGDKEPQLSDLRDSGAIEQDLDVAILLWTLEEQTDDVRLVGFKVAKHRGGAKGRFCMRFEAPIYRWNDCDWPPKPTAPAPAARRWQP